MKVPLALDKRAWQPSLLPGQIVLVSTADRDGRPNVAPKSWLSMVAMDDPVLGFGCNVGHTTYRNAQATGEFAVNVLPVGEAERAWALADVHGEERLADSGLSLVPAQRVAAPLVAECRAHLECELVDVKLFGEEVFAFGRIVAASIDAACLEGPPDGRYAGLAPVFYLESGMYAALGAPRRVR